MKGAKALILALLKKRPATGLEIFNATGCLDYRSRICELKALGYPIGGYYVNVKNRHGEVCRVKRHYLVREKT